MSPIRMIINKGYFSIKYCWGLVFVCQRSDQLYGYK